MKTNLLIAIVLVGGCATDSGKPKGPEVLPDLTMPPKPTNGVQILTPIFDNIQPAMDYEVCTWTDYITDKVTDVRSTLFQQNEPPGHHALVFYTTTQQPPGTTRVCNDSDMATFRLLSGSATPGELNVAPGDLVYRIPANAQIVINHHYLNATDQVLRGQAVVNLNFADPGNYTPSGNLAVLDLNLDVTPGMYSHNLHCSFDRDYKLWYVIPHMHQWGTRQTVDLTVGGVKTRMFDVAWDPSFAFHPPEKRVDTATPIVVHKGDTIDSECDYNNDSGHDLTFGLEMCVVFGQFINDAGVPNMVCDAGQWGTF